LLIYAGWSGRLLTPALFGGLLAALGLFAFANTAASTFRLDSGTLTGRSLLNRVEVPVDQITGVVPIDLTHLRTILMLWNRRARIYDVCTSSGPTGLRLNPYLYGDRPLYALLRQIHVGPETSIEIRVLDPRGGDRDYEKR
jgi:hypothetical protein